MRDFSVAASLLGAGITVMNKADQLSLSGGACRGESKRLALHFEMLSLIYFEVLKIIIIFK